MTTAKSSGSLIGKIGSYLQIVAKDPSSTAFVPLAEAYRQTGLMDDALEAARLGTQKMPHFSPGFSTLGRILGQMGRLDEAMSAYAKALSLDRQSQSALVGLARLHLVRGERDQARKILKQAEEFHPDDEKIVDMLNALDLPRPWAEIQQAAQHQDVAAEAADVKEEKAEPIPTATLAEIYVKQGLVDKAIKTYQDILQQNPENDAARERIMELKEGVAAELGASEGASEQTDEVVAEAAPQSVPDAQQTDEPKKQSPLEVMQSWLNAIRQGRENV